jgi:hypothetical protein
MLVNLVRLLISILNPLSKPFPWLCELCQRAEPGESLSYNIDKGQVIFGENFKIRLSQEPGVSVLERFPAYFMSGGLFAKSGLDN